MKPLAPCGNDQIERSPVTQHHRHACRAQLLGRDEEVAGEVLSLLLADVEVPGRREVRDVQHVRAPEDHHLDGLHVRQLHLVGAHVRPALHQRVGVRAGRCIVGNLERLGLRLRSGHGRTRCERIDRRGLERIRGGRKRTRGGSGRKRIRATAAERIRRWRSRRCCNGRRRSRWCRRGSDRRRSGSGGSRRRRHRCGSCRNWWRCGGRSRLLRSRLRLGRRCFSALEHDAGAADLDLIAHVQLALVHPGAIDHRARLVTEVDQRDVLGTGDFDHGVHARRELVVDPQMTLRILADLHDVLRDGLPPLQGVALVERERENSLCHALPFLDSLF